MRPLQYTIKLLLGISVLHAQATFELASVKPAEPLVASNAQRPARGCRGGPGTAEPTRFTCTHEPLWNLLFLAYRLTPYQFTYPDWMATTQFDISAIVPEDATKDQLPAMIRALLTERFKLSAHYEKKEAQIYEMTIAPGGPKFEAWADQPPIPENELPKTGPVKAANMRVPPGATSVSWSDLNGRHASKAKESMEGLAASLSSSSMLDRPVIDATGLTGTYDIMLEYVKPADYPPGREPLDANGQPFFLADGPTLFNAVQSELGLRLESKKGMIDTFVIDHIERAPTPN